MAHSNNKHGLTLTALVALLLAGGPALGVGTADGDYGDEYRSGDYGRVRDAERGVTLVRADWNQEQAVRDEGGINAPVFPGDRVTTEDDQRVEVQLADGTLVWIDRHSDVTFLALPDPYAEVTDHAVLQLADGRLRLAAALRDDEELRVDTPAASVYPVGDADVRIEVGAGGRTRVFSRRGVVEVVGGGASVLLRGGMRTEVEPGTMPDDPEPFNTFSGDGFDQYVERRETALDSYDYAGGSEAYRELPSEVQPYYRELDSSGNWIHVDDYGYVWQPVGVAADWRPYHHGHWGYGPHGYFWVSNEPWGWAPYHYGRWTWIGGRGWCWSPGSIFAGAWVSWSWGSAYIGWSPLDYWGYPAYRSAAYYGYYDPHCWTWVSYHHLHHHDYHHYSVGWDHVRHDAHRAAVVTRPPRVAPGRLARSSEARRRALDEVRQRPGREVRRTADARPRDGSFRQTENRLTRRGSDVRARRDATRVPNGRARTVPANVQRPGRRGGSAVDRDRGRGRQPVVRTPSRRGADSSARASSPRSQDRAPRATTRSGASRSNVRSDDGKSGGRVRDIYRKMAKPRQTRERPAASKGSTKSGSSATSPSSKPRARPKPSGSTRKTGARSQPKPKSGGERKARPRSSNSSSRPEVRSSSQVRRPAARPSTPERRRTTSVQRSPKRPSPSARESTPRPSSSARKSTPRPSPRGGKTSADSSKRSSSPKKSAGKTRSSGSRGSTRGSSRGSSRRGGRR